MEEPCDHVDLDHYVTFYLYCSTHVSFACTEELADSVMREYKRYLQGETGKIAHMQRGAVIDLSRVCAVVKAKKEL